MNTLPIFLLSAGFLMSLVLMRMMNAPRRDQVRAVIRRKRK